MLFGCTLEPCGFSSAFITTCLYNLKKGEQKDNTAFFPMSSSTQLHYFTLHLYKKWCQSNMLSRDQKCLIWINCSCVFLRLFISGVCLRFDFYWFGSAPILLKAPGIKWGCGALNCTHQQVNMQIAFNNHSAWKHGEIPCACYWDDLYNQSCVTCLLKWHENEQNENFRHWIKN